MPSKKSSPFKKGFKAWAETEAVSLRELLSLAPHDCLRAELLAAYLKVPIFSITEWHGDIEPLRDSGFSALTMINSQKRRLIVHNTFHALQRQQSNLMHELAHIICKHEPPSFSEIPIPGNVRSYNEQDEREAEFFGGCLQLPKVALYHFLKQRIQAEEIAEHFCASLQMVTYRINITGLRKQMQYWR